MKKKTRVNKYPELTEKEQDEIGGLMLTAALKELKAAGEFSSDAGDGETARLVVKALAAAAKVRKSEAQRLGESKGGHVDVTTDVHQVVATAFWVWSADIDVNEIEVAATSVAGLRFLGFVHGLQAARAMDEAIDLLNEDDMFWVAGGGALQLLAREQG